jgi:predicted transcriptional regulator
MMITAKREEITRRMAKAGFTGAGLASAAGISQSYIVLLLSGKRNMRPPTAKRICEALKCEFDDVFILKTQGQAERGRGEDADN